ncbi:MAG TPA: hypothetical protein VMI32_20505 [Candidatus Solibacter sp.]|nr:hypothetical protein [Candidatus Solibacter sp.]
MGRVGNGFQPGILPEEQAARLAATVRASITSGVEVNGPADPATPHGENGIAGLVSPLVNLKSLPAEGKHFGHKWHSVEAPLRIQSLEDFFLALDFDPITHS